MPQLSTQQALDLAFQHHRARRLQEAEQLYRQVLVQEPSHVDATHHLGILAYQCGRNEAASELFRRAILLRPDFPEALCYLGSALKDSGMEEEAITAYRQAIALAPTMAEALSNLGTVLQAGGQLDEAIDLFRRAISAAPNSPEVRNNLGIALVSKGNFTEAVEAFKDATAANDSIPEIHRNLGNALKESGRLEEAIAAYRKALLLRPDYVAAQSEIADALRDNANWEEAITAYRRVVGLNSNCYQANDNLGRIFLKLKWLDEAIAAFRRTIVIKPDLAEVHNNLGIALQDNGQFDDAVVAYRKAIALAPNMPEAHSNLANALNETDQLEEAVTEARRAIELLPTAKAQTTLGNVLQRNGQPEAAIEAQKQAIAMNADYVEGYNHLANALVAAGRVDEAVAAYGHAIELSPGFPEAHTNRAIALLLRGDLEKGWAEHEWRWKCKEFSKDLLRYAQPQWDGLPIEGRTLLLYAEQGYGDTLQFVRYAPAVARLGGRVILACPPGLRRLFEQFAPRIEIILPGTALPQVDFCCPIMSLPLAFKTRLDSVPSQVPYLAPETGLLDTWRQRLALDQSKRNVAIAWAGRPGFKGDRTRSITLHHLTPFADVPEVNFYSIQKGAPARQIADAPLGRCLRDLSPQLDDFADTAAVMSLMDLVITTDTGPAHLAGALGCATWMMLQRVPDWRWLMDRPDTPWYPTMRLFRQTSLGDWNGVIHRVADELRNFPKPTQA